MDGQERNARARWRRETRYRQLILRFGEPRPQIGRGLNWSRGSRNRIARATPRPATYSARPRFKEPDHPISAPFLSARCPPSSLSLSLSLCPREGNRSAPIRRVCSVKSTRPRGEGPRGGKQDSCFSTDFSASSVTRERSPLFCKRDEEKSNLFRILLLFDKYVGEQIRDTISIVFLFFFLSPILVASYFDEYSHCSNSFCFRITLHEFEYESETESEENRSDVARSIIKMMRNKAEFVQRGAEQYRYRSIFAISSSDKDESLAESFVLGGVEKQVDRTGPWNTAS